MVAHPHPILFHMIGAQGVIHSLDVAPYSVNVILDYEYNLNDNPSPTPFAPEELELVPVKEEEPKKLRRWRFMKWRRQCSQA